MATNPQDGKSGKAPGRVHPLVENYRHHDVVSFQAKMDEVLLAPQPACAVTIRATSAWTPLRTSALASPPLM
jgi:hypothetical protein